MKTELTQAMASGVWVELRDAAGNTLAQSVFADWNSSPVPAIGDTMCCPSSRSGGPRKLLGRVVERHFDVQHDEHGDPCVWVHVVLQFVAPRGSRQAPASRGFSQN